MRRDALRTEVRLECAHQVKFSTLSTQMRFRIKCAASVISEHGTCSSEISRQPPSLVVLIPHVSLCSEALRRPVTTLQAAPPASLSQTCMTDEYGMMECLVCFGSSGVNPHSPFPRRMMGSFYCSCRPSRCAARPCAVRVGASAPTPPAILHDVPTSQAPCCFAVRPSMMIVVSSPAFVQVDAVLIPCQHSGLCFTCAEMILRRATPECPICRCRPSPQTLALIRTSVSLFLSLMQTHLIANISHKDSLATICLFPSFPLPHLLPLFSRTYLLFQDLCTGGDSIRRLRHGGRFRQDHREGCRMPSSGGGRRKGLPPR